MCSKRHQDLMAQAVALARKGEGRTSPNPPVGAVIVQNGQVVGEGFHPKAGEPHAEIFALRQAGELACGADIYVTLEPCSHFGQTPPCADALIAAGIKNVYVGVSDPNPQVAGQGIARLKAAGINVYVGLLEEECQELIAAFSKHVTTGMPYTIYKAALTLDGQSATAEGDSRWVSCEQSRQRVHQMRDRVDAIMVGVGTVCQDDPLLTTRLDFAPGQDPMRIVVDSYLRMPLNSRMLQQQSEAKTLIATVSVDQERIAQFEKVGAQVLCLEAEHGQVSLPALWRELGRRQIQKILLEGGATLAGSALNKGLIDQVMIFIAPKIVNGSNKHGLFNGAGCKTMAEAVQLKKMKTEQVGTDLLITAQVGTCLPV